MGVARRLAPAKRLQAVVGAALRAVYQAIEFTYRV